MKMRSQLIAQPHAAGGQAEIDAHAISIALQIREIEIMPGQHAAHRRVVEKLGMTAHGRKHARALVRSLFIEVPRRAFERASEVFGRDVLCEPRRALQHLLLQQMQRLFVFADERGGFLRQRRADQIADGEKIAPPRVARFRRDMQDHALDEVLGAFIPMRVFFAVRCAPQARPRSGRHLR